MKTKKGFTLAEVLITLAIIGVVAALTIPTLLMSTGQGHAESALKKSLSVLNQAISMNVATNKGDATGPNDASELANYFAGQLSVISRHGTDGTEEGFTTIDGISYTFWKDTDPCGAGYERYDIATGDQVAIHNTLILCTGAIAAGEACRPYYSNVLDTAKCIIEVSITGPGEGKRVSRVGQIRDTFYFVVNRSSVVPGEPSVDDITLNKGVFRCNVGAGGDCTGVDDIAVQIISGTL